MPSLLRYAAYAIDMPPYRAAMPLIFAFDTRYFHYLCLIFSFRCLPPCRYMALLTLLLRRCFSHVLVTDAADAARFDIDD